MVISTSTPFGPDPELAALLNIDVDLGPLDRGLNEGRRRTAAASGQMAQSLTGFSRAGRFAFQNASHQVQDFVVQVAAGQGALRAFALQAPQFASAFGPVGTVIGTVIAIAAGLGAAFLSSGRDAKASSADIDTLDAALKRLVTTSDEGEKALENLTQRFVEARGAAREFILEAARVDLARAEASEVTAREEFGSATERLQRPRAGGGLTAEQSAGLGQLSERFKARQDVTAFREELESFAAQADPVVARRIRALGDELVKAGEQALVAAQETERAGEALAKLQRLQEQGAKLSPEDLGPEAATGRAAAAPVDETARGIEVLSRKIRDLRGEIEVARAGPLTDLGEQLKDVNDIAQSLDLSPEEIAQLPAEVRELVQAYIELRVELRAVEAANKDAIAAQAQSQREAEQLQAAQAAAARRARADAEREKAQRERRIQSGGELPDDIDVANIAARELSTTLTDLDTLSLAGLQESFVQITRQIIQMVIQALIFRAIMAGIGGAFGGAPGAVIAGGAGSATLRHGGVFAGGRLTTARHGAVFRRGQQALMTGAVSGAALLEGAGDEAAVPLTRTRSGDLGVRVEGGGGTTVYNIDARQAAPGTASTIANIVTRVAPGAVINARARGRMRDRAPF